MEGTNTLHYGVKFSLNYPLSSHSPESPPCSIHLARFNDLLFLNQSHSVEVIANSPEKVRSVFTAL
eukprot:401626-Amorphochlora_amoeboformis.AAC.1